MKRKVSKLISLAVCLILCFSLVVPAWAYSAGGVRVTATLTPNALNESTSAQTAELIVAFSEPVALTDIEFKIVLPASVTVSEPTTQYGASGTASWNPTNKSLMWMANAGTVVQNVTEMFRATITLPANFSASTTPYTIGVTEVYAGDEADYFIEDGSTSVTFTVHAHNFNQKVEQDKFKVPGSTASCTEGVSYFFSCSCGEKGTETFKSTEVVDHEFKDKIEDAAHLKNKGADCKHGNTYWYDCANCDAISTKDSFTSTTKMGDHKYDMSKFDHKEKNGHAHLCTVCKEAHDTLQDHIPGPAATEEVPQTCTACNYEIAPMLNHEHKFNQEVVADKYLKSAADCQNAAVYYKSCKCELASETEFFFYGEPNATAHKLATTWTTENGEHFHKCTVTGCTYEADKAACSGGTATCLKKAVCGECGEEYGKLADHAWQTEWSYDEETHWYACDFGCVNKKDEADHEFDEDGFCICGYEENSGNIKLPSFIGILGGGITPFEDVNTTDWFYDEVLYVYNHKLMTGMDADTFAPNGTMTRAMVWTVLGRMDGQVFRGTGSEWYAEAQAWAIKAGVSDGSNPNGAITREELVTMMWRFAGSPKTDVSVLNNYNDGANVSDWAKEAMAWAVNWSIVEGSNWNLTPNTTALRCQVAAILTRYCK